MMEGYAQLVKTFVPTWLVDFQSFAKTCKEQKIKVNAPEVQLVNLMIEGCAQLVKMEADLEARAGQRPGSAWVVRSAF